MLGSNPALNTIQVKLAIEVDENGGLAYDFNPVDCTVTYHVNVVIVDTENKFLDIDGTEYNYMVASPVDFTQTASRLQIRNYLAKQNLDVLNIDQNNTTSTGDLTSTAINNPANTFQSIGVFFDKKTFECNDNEAGLE
jgi:hypothetical protein